MAVKAELERIKLGYELVELGKVKLLNGISPYEYNEIKVSLEKMGLELIIDRKIVLIERIKKAILELVNGNDEQLNVNFSAFLGKQLAHNYTYLANVFSEVEHTTIEKFLIASKVDRIKMMLEFDDKNITEISYIMHYSSVAHLSNQFKKVTGFTPSHYKHLKEHTYALPATA